MSTFMASLEAVAAKFQSIFSIAIVSSVVWFAATTWTNLTNKVDHVSEDVTNLKVEMKDVKKDIETMKDDILIIKADITVLKSDVREMKADINEIKRILIKKNP